ncbi:MAG TPA: hypothetical protein VF947_01395 [Myxococcales bacterium]
MGFVRLQRLVYGIRNALRPSRTTKARRVPDPRADADPWLAKILDELGDRYQLGKDTPDGIQVLRRTARTRFNPMRVYLQPETKRVVGDYDVRLRGGKSLAEGRALLDRKVSAPLSQFGVQPLREAVEEWGGQVIVRRYQGASADPMVAAAAVRFICEQSEQVMDASAE